MKPNGVFLINKKHDAQVVESSLYPTLLASTIWATQSGPLLVSDGIINHNFNTNSENKKVRSGVGVTKKGIIVFALSQAPVTFHDFASLFLTKLECQNALFLDGEISAFYVPGTKEVVAHNFGPMFGIIESTQ